MERSVNKVDARNSHSEVKGSRAVEWKCYYFIQMIVVWTGTIAVINMDVQKVVMRTHMSETPAACDMPTPAPAPQRAIRTGIDWHWAMAIGHYLQDSCHPAAAAAVPGVPQLASARMIQGERERGWGHPGWSVMRWHNEEQDTRAARARDAGPKMQECADGPMSFRRSPQRYHRLTLPPSFASFLDIFPPTITLTGCSGWHTPYPHHLSVTLNPGPTFLGLIQHPGNPRATSRQPTPQAGLA
jgi:hypothetical protein